MSGAIGAGLVCHLVSVCLLLSVVHAAPQVFSLGDALEVSDPYAESLLGSSVFGDLADTPSDADGPDTSASTTDADSPDTSANSTDADSPTTSANTDADSMSANVTDADSPDTPTAKPTDAPSEDGEAEPSTPKQIKLASQKEELRTAEIEWKDAWDSTEAPGKLLIPITPLPNAEDHTWLKQMVENQKPAIQVEEIASANDAMTSALKLMKRRPSTDALSTAEILAGDLTRVKRVADDGKPSNSTRFVTDAKATRFVHDATTKDPQTIAADAEVEQARFEMQQADAELNSAKETVTTEATLEKARLKEEFIKHQARVTAFKKAKNAAIKAAAETVAKLQASFPEMQKADDSADDSPK